MFSRDYPPGARLAFDKVKGEGGSLVPGVAWIIFNGAVRDGVGSDLKGCEWDVCGV